METRQTKRLKDAGVPPGVISRIDPREGGHWVWVGSMTNGYGIALIADSDGVSRRQSVSRYIYGQLVRPLQSRERLIRKCPQAGCVNPEHHKAELPAGVRRK